MATYSVGSPPVDAEKLADLQSILNKLQDNTSKLIDPHDVRDAIYTCWENITLKSTGIPTSLIDYIGIDQTDLTKKIFLGKKKIEGEYVLSDQLLNSDADIFIYNTKAEPQSDYNTKVVLLAGTGSNYYLGQIRAPFFESKQVENGNGSVINLEIGNKSFNTDMAGTYSGGDINILTDYGYVTINGVRFPKYSPPDDSKSGYFLKYQVINDKSYAYWESAFTSSVSSIYSDGEVNIVGNPVKINGFDMMFTESTPVPYDIGGIQAGETFDNVSLSMMIRRILYPYIKPYVSTSMNYKLIESGDTLTVGNLSMSYTILRSSTQSISSILVYPGSFFGTLLSPGSISQNITYTDQILPNIPYDLSSGDNWEIFTYTMSVSDGISNALTSSSVGLVIPWYYGTATISCTSSNIGNSINNILSSSNVSQYGKLKPILAEPVTSTSSVFNKKLYISTDGLDNNQGFIYFGYPSDMPDITEIYDQDNYLMDINSDFTKYIISGVQSPDSYWNNKEYKFYITNYATSVPVGSLYSFNFVTASNI